MKKQWQQQMGRTTCGTSGVSLAGGLFVACVLLLLGWLCAVLVLPRTATPRSGIITSPTETTTAEDAQVAAEDGSPFSLFVTLQFTVEAHKKTFLNAIRPVAEYVKLHEPSTIAYEVLLSDKDPLMVLIVERYSDKDDAYFKVHKASQAFLEFRPKLQALIDDGHVTISGHSYYDSGAGFIGRG